MFTYTKPTVRHIKPDDLNGRSLVKVVYVVLEPQYQSAISAAVRSINAKHPDIAIEISGYLIEELRDNGNYEDFKRDVAEANIFIASLIFLEDLADKIVAAVEPIKDNLDVSVVFPSMPQVMRLNKMGSFSLAQIGQSKSVIGSFMKKRKEKSGAGFQDAMLKLLRTLPTVLKFLPIEKAQDARNFMLSFQYWLGGNEENLESFFLMLADKYVFNGKDTKRSDNNETAAFSYAEPITYLDMGIWHPLAPTMYDDAKEYLNWYASRKDLPEAQRRGDCPTIGLVMQRTHIVTGDDAHYVSMVAEFEAMGARVISVFAGGLDFSKPVAEYFYEPINKEEAIVDAVVSLTGFALVGGPAKQDHPKAIDALKKLNRPYMVALPLVFQTTEEWLESDLGLHPIQVALQIALPELDGAIEPIVMSGRDGATGKSITLQDRVETIAKRALKWANLRSKKQAEKKVAITVFSFPPDKGNVGTAAYLDVFGSIYKVLEGLKEDGYTIGELPEDSKALMLEILHDAQAQYSSPDLNVAYRMSVEEYERLTPYHTRLHDSWGPAPGNLNTDGQNLLIFGKQFGNVFIGVQPTFGYEGDPMRLLFSRSASPHHGFAAYYTYLERVFDADAVLHFGTHGSLEFMPGKQMGMSETCFPDSLIGSIPNLYYYAANNPSEATIAKRRSYAETISYLTPPAENAGLYKGLKALGELIASYQTLKDGGRGIQIVDSIMDQARICNLDRDVKLPDTSSGELNQDQRDTIVGKIYIKIMEIESRLLPCGLHTIGKPPTADEAIATLVNIASLDRDEDGILSLTRVIANSVYRDIDEIFKNSDLGVLKDVQLLNDINAASREAVTAMVRAQQDEDGRVSKTSIFGNLFNGLGGKQEPWVEVLYKLGYGNVDGDAIKPLFEFLQFCLKQVVADNELGGLLTALNGEYLTPGPGGDPIRNPDVLPTGKNIHALDPQSIPTTAAVSAAKVVVDRLIDRQRLENDGAYPETIACVLWGTDNIKTYGESLAQILWMVGTKPVADAFGRVNKLELIPLNELGRPRIDVVVNCSGVFRDLFMNQMALLDQAVKMAAEADEPLDMNYVRKHAIAQAAELGVSVRQAATRVFSNASGSYSSNINLAVENGTWENEEELQNMYLARKGFAFSSDNPGVMEQKEDIFRASLKTADVTFQNLDSSEISLTDVSHYYDSDPTKIVSRLRDDGKAPTSYMADTTTANAQIRTLSETVRLDSRTKLLNPKWYEGMLSHGYEGVRELSKRLVNTMGWSATADAVDNWVYEDANSTFMKDKEMQERLLNLNPNSFRKMVTTLLEANGRGYWETSDENLDRLRELYQQVEDRIEGVES